MTWKTFLGADNRDRIAAAVAEVELPVGVAIRLGDVQDDGSAIGDLPGDTFVDTIDPKYGMVASDCADEFTLVAERDGVPIGQISVDMEMRGESLTGMDLFVVGVFVSNDDRGQGVGRALGEAAVRTAESWRRDQALALGRGLDGDIDVTGDTEPDTGGDRVVDHMAGLAMELSDEAFGIEEKNRTGIEP